MLGLFEGVELFAVGVGVWGGNYIKVVCHSVECNCVMDREDSKTHVESCLGDSTFGIGDEAELFCYGAFEVFKDG